MYSAADGLQGWKGQKEFFISCNWGTHSISMGSTNTIPYSELWGKTGQDHLQVMNHASCRIFIWIFEEHPEVAVDASRNVGYFSICKCWLNFNMWMSVHFQHVNVGQFSICKCVHCVMLILCICLTTVTFPTPWVCPRRCRWSAAAVRVIASQDLKVTSSLPVLRMHCQLNCHLLLDQLRK